MLLCSHLRPKSLAPNPNLPSPPMGLGLSGVSHKALARVSHAVAVGHGGAASSEGLTGLEVDSGGTRGWQLMPAVGEASAGAVDHRASTWPLHVAGASLGWCLGSKSECSKEPAGGVHGFL